ncbi:MAG: glutamine--fructose-6-phosphate transaminase (isomerizing), partial [Syntrophomonas sp.]|nr:glutamine--fructose-6-phosphate transaminase (isomerizing) [Syntrophomonas sp.]
MCGIMGYIGDGNAVPVIIDGLSKLEYRGYDSAGIALYKPAEVNKRQTLLVNEYGERESSGSASADYKEGSIEIIKKKGRLSEMVEVMGDYSPANLCIGHTRWATHGVPSDENAHPHTDCSGHIALVHNGIIENYSALRKQLILEGHDFISETDTEVIVHLVEKYYDGSLEEAVRKTLTYVNGSFAIVVICSDEPDKIIAAKKDSPMIVGLGEGENYLASDIPAIIGKTKRVYIIEDNEFVVIKKDSVVITDFTGSPVAKQIFEVDWDVESAEKGGFEHFMLKEIHEQPTALRETLRGNIKAGMIDLSDLGIDDLFINVEKIYIVACGTAYHAGLVGRSVLEKLARIPVETDIASEFRYREILWAPHSVMIVISQSGETADTLAVLREAKRNGIKVLAVTNVVGSTVAREAHQVIYTHAGPEIAVASTKAYSTQLLVMYMLGLHLARVRGTCTLQELAELTEAIARIDNLVEQVLLEEDKIKKLAEKYQNVQDTFFLGRGLDYAVAREGALKLKEISYIHAEAYAAGE